MFKRILLMFISCFVLCTCSSGERETVTICQAPCATDDPPEGVVETTRTLEASDGLTGGLEGADYNPVTGVFTVTASGLFAQMNRFPTANYSDFLAMRDAAGVHNAYYAQGQGTEIMIYSGGLAGSVLNVGSYARQGATEMPLTGKAEFNGDYVGFTPTRRINGKAQLDVNFADSSISGRITDRIFRQRPDNIADVVNPLSTLVLAETSLRADGSFQGMTAGGQIVNGQTLWNPATGSFAGLVGGATGNEIVGTVAVTHRAPTGASFDEIGGFLAAR